MNRYLLRSLVAVSTFLLSIAVWAVIHPFGSRRWEHQYSTYVYHGHHCRRAMSFPTPYLSIDTLATDPVKLLYSQTRPLPYSSKQQIVLSLDNQTTKPIRAVIVRYGSAPSDFEYQSVRVTYDPNLDLEDLKTVTIDCGSDQTLWLWISNVEFKDGSRWVNPRHSSELRTEY